MCLAIPMQLVAVRGTRGTARAGGLEVEVALELVDDAAVGDFVIVHAGYAIQRLSADEARETLEIFAKLEELQQ
jgi:hydrogenase expression/formation protein HypC